MFQNKKVWDLTKSELDFFKELLCPEFEETVKRKSVFQTQ